MKTYILPAGADVDVWIENVGWRKIRTTHSAFLTYREMIGASDSAKEIELDKYINSNNVEGYFLFMVEHVMFQVSSKALTLWSIGD